MNGYEKQLFVSARLNFIFDLISIIKMMKALKDLIIKGLRKLHSIKTRRLKTKISYEGYFLYANTLKRYWRRALN